MKQKDRTFIKVDFDGTLVKHVYPEIGEPCPLAFQTCKDLQILGYELILCTMRSGRQLEEAIEFCKENGLTFTYINDNPTQRSWTTSPKIYASWYIGDDAVGSPLVYPDNKNERPYTDWTKIREFFNLPKRLVDNND